MSSVKLNTPFYSITLYYGKKNYHPCCKWRIPTAECPHPTPRHSSWPLPPSTLPYSLLRGQGRQADWLSTKKYLSVLSFFLSKVEPHPPQPQTKQVFYINPIATPRFQNTTSKVRFPSFIHPSSLPAHPPAPVCPHSVLATLPDINNPMSFSHHSQRGRYRGITDESKVKKKKKNVKFNVLPLNSANWFDN